MSEAIEEKAVDAAGKGDREIIFDSPPSEADDDVWIAHGAKMLEDSVPSVRSAASELIKALGLLLTVYMGILGFAKFVPENMEVYNKALFFLPVIPWVTAIYYCLRVMKTEVVRINLRSPSDIREKAAKLLEEKQQNLEVAFLLLIAGIVAAFVMVVFRVRM